MPPLILTDADLKKIPHYHGDYVRQLSLAGVALMLVTSPLYAANIRSEIPFEVIGAIVIVGLAAYTNPLKRWVFLANAFLSGFLAGIYGYWGLFDYETSSLTAFVLRISIALIFLFSFYFSVKTLRAMTLHEVGVSDDVLEQQIVAQQQSEKEGEQEEHEITAREYSRDVELGNDSD